VWLSAIDLPVRLICILEGCLQGFTDEVLVAPNPANYYLPHESTDALDTFGGSSMIADYQGRIVSEHKYGTGPSYGSSPTRFRRWIVLE
jgi:hypothetical protein